MKEETCGCCEGTAPAVPMPVTNRPGLDQIRYRVGVHGAFLETMLSGLSSNHSPALAGLTTRDRHDPAIALLDAGAVLLDVLTFYQERIANEGFLRTAVQRRSILELARLVGYRLRPGVASSVFLAFDLENEAEVEVPAGTRVQSIPNPGELPQPFETSEALTAQAAWNDLTPRLTQPQVITPATAPELTQVYYAGVTTNLKPNDRLLFAFSKLPENQVIHVVETVTTDTAANFTLVTLQQPLETVEASLATREISPVEGLRIFLENHLDFQRFNVSAETAMAGRVAERVRQLLVLTEPGVAAADLNAAIEGVLPSLSAEHEITIEREYERLEPWVGSLVQELETFQTASRLRISQKSAPVTGLEGILSPLLIPPAHQPRSSAALRRSAEGVFAPASDSVPRLLAAFQPGLKDQLYQAWGNTQVTMPLAPDLANVLRVKAAPFGHNAPLKVIQDDEGVIIGQEEWGLATSTIRVELAPVSGAADLFESLSNDQVDAELTVIQAGEGASWQQQIRDLDPDESELVIETTLGTDLPAVITIHYSHGEVIGTLNSIEFDVLEKTIRISNTGDTLTVSMDGTPVLVGIDQGSRQRRFFEGMRVVANFASGGAFTLNVTRVPSPPLGSQRRVLSMDAEYPQIIPGSWVVIERVDWATPRAFLVQEVNTVSLAEYGLTGKVTQLRLNQPWLEISDLDLSAIRGTTVYAQSEVLILAEEPITSDISGSKLELGALYAALESGRWIVVSGERTDIPGTTGVIASELAMISTVEQSYNPDLPGDQVHTTLHLANSLAYTYLRSSVKIYGNVVKATHGETRQEVLGSGSGALAFQTFTLKQFPLTYVSAVTPSGVETTLEVRVNDVLWPEKENLLLSPQERGYITQTSDDSKTTVKFGDGIFGARLPSGPENVRAVYRSGIGKSGNVPAGQISLLAMRPLGVKSVINPLPATGGAEPESRDAARQNAPLAVKALDRLIGVLDYADFARTFAGVGKASAAVFSDGRSELVHVSIAGAENIPITEDSDLFLNLRQALVTFGDPSLRVSLAVRRLKLLVIAARVKILPEFLWEVVSAQIRSALLQTFGFDQRQLGQDVTSSEVIATIQQVPGVVYVDLDLLDGVHEDTDLSDLAALAETLTLKSRVTAALARLDPSVRTPPRPVLPAELACLVPEIPDLILLTELTL
jgi:predicted phage baseplate assembly protein